MGPVDFNFETEYSTTQNPQELWFSEIQNKMKQSVANVMKKA